MNMYNAVFGENPMAEILLGALGLKREDVPRYRDVYLTEDGGTPYIVIYTRTGGGNRAYYDSEESCRSHYPDDFTAMDPPSGPWNDDLRNRPTFLRDKDDDFDSTYASFVFAVPETYLRLCTVLHQTLFGTLEEPSQRWRKLLDDLNNKKKDSPEVTRLYDLCKGIFDRMKQATDK